MKLFAFNNNQIKSDLPDVVLFQKLETFTNASVNFLDRTLSIVPPFHMDIPEDCRLPAFDPHFNISYEECCQQRVRAIVERQNQTDRPITLFYSGGIDSSLVLTSFIKELGQSDAEKRVKVVMTSTSISENPWMWEKVLRRSQFELISGERHQSLYRNNIIVTGELNDQLHGSDMYRALISLYGDGILDAPWSEEGILHYLKRRGLDKVTAARWCRLLMGQVLNAPCEIVTLADFWWWINFSCKWTSVYWRMLLFTSEPEVVKPDWLGNYVHFFGTPNFQKWSMINRSQKHQGSWITYKWHARDLVCDLVGREYADKTKRGSLWEIMRVKKKFAAIDNTFGFHDGFDIDRWYNPNNSFTG